MFHLVLTPFKLFSLDIYGFNPTLCVSTDAYHLETVIIVPLS